MTNPAIRDQGFQGHENIESLIKAHAGQIQAMLNKGHYSRCFNDIPYRKTLPLALNFFDSAKGCPPLNPEQTDEENRRDAIVILKKHTKLSRFHQRAQHHAAKELFDATGELKPEIKTLLEPAISNAYKKPGETTESVNRKILQSYYITFILHQASEAKANNFRLEFDQTGLPVTPEATNALNLITAVSNHELTHPSETLPELCQKALSTDNKLQYLRWAQYCAQHVHENPSRFLLASRTLNIAISNDLNKNFTQDDLLNAYSELAEQTPKIALSKKAIKRLTEISHGLSDHQQQTSAQSCSHATIEAARGLISTSSFLSTATTNYQYDSKLGSNQKVAEKFINTVSKNELYSAWRAESKLSWWNLRNFDGVTAIDKRLKKIETMQNKKSLKPEAILEEMLALKLILDTWVEKKSIKVAESHSLKSRLPAALKLQRKIDTACAKRAKEVYREALQPVDDEEQAYIAQREEKKGCSRFFSTAHFSSPKAAALSTGISVCAGVAAASYMMASGNLAALIHVKTFAIYAVELAAAATVTKKIWESDTVQRVFGRR